MGGAGRPLPAKGPPAAVPTGPTTLPIARAVPGQPFGRSARSGRSGVGYNRSTIATAQVRASTRARYDASKSFAVTRWRSRADRYSSIRVMVGRSPGALVAEAVRSDRGPSGSAGTAPAVGAVGFDWVTR